MVRSFRQSTGKTPYQELPLRRIERARIAMRNRRESLADVALVSSFADQHHLASVFRRVSGVMPSSYRRTLRWFSPPAELSHKKATLRNRHLLLIVIKSPA